MEPPPVVSWVGLYVNLSIYLSVCLSLCLTIYLAIHYVSRYQFTHDTTNSKHTLRVSWRHEEAMETPSSSSSSVSTAFTLTSSPSTLVPSPVTGPFIGFTEMLSCLRAGKYKSLSSLIPLH